MNQPTSSVPWTHARSAWDTRTNRCWFAEDEQRSPEWTAALDLQAVPAVDDAAKPQVFSMDAERGHHLNILVPFRPALGLPPFDQMAGYPKRSRALSFPTSLVTRLSGVPLTTLVNWTHRRLLTPARRGRPGVESLYSFRDMVALRIAAELKRRGLDIDLEHLGLVIEYVRNREGLELESEIPVENILVSDGRGFREAQSTASFMEIRQGGDAASVLLIPFGELVNKLQSEARIALASARAA